MNTPVEWKAILFGEKSFIIVIAEIFLIGKMVV
jgi:hypothetical protein